MTSKSPSADSSCRASVTGTGMVKYGMPEKLSADILYELARSESMWERRTAIVSTSCLIRQCDPSDTFEIAEILLGNDQDLIHRATGGWLRKAGKKDRQRLLSFLDKHAATMPPTALRSHITAR